MRKLKRKTILKEAGVLLIAAVMILSAVTVTANTDKALKIPKNMNLISRDEFLSESFDDGIPGDWTQEYVAGEENYDWDQYYGGWFWDPPGEKHPEEPHTEPWNVMFEPTVGPEGAITKLITPSMDLNGAEGAKLTFWYAMAEDETVQPAHTGQEIITVYYKTSAAGAWIEVPGGHYEDDTPDWTETTLDLPDLSADYYIAFEGEYHWGYGACIDDVVVFGDDTPPLVADADGPYEASEDEPIQFQGSAEGGVPPYSFHWDFDDGDTSDIQNPMHTYTNTGNYTVTLTVTDDESDTASDTTWALINEPPSAPDISGTEEGEPGESYSYYFTSTDPDGDDVSYFIDWGDGETTDWTPYRTSGAMLNEDHEFSEYGTFIIKAKAKDIYNAESDWGELEIAMPRNRAVNTPFLNFLESHPILYQLLLRFLLL